MELDSLGLRFTVRANGKIKSMIQQRLDRFKAMNPAMPPNFEVVFVSEEELHNIYVEKVELSSVFTKEHFSKKWEFVHDSLRNALSIQWVEDCCGEADFAVGDDWSLTWCQCGGVYSSRICCPAYVETILGVLNKMPDSSKWAYSTAVENLQQLDDFPLPPFVSGEFILKAGRMYVAKDGYDYSRFFKG